MTARALLVPDCGNGVGLGHLERMLALADAMRPEAEASVVVPVGQPGLVSRVADRGHGVLAAPGDACSRAGAAAGASDADVIVLDGYVFDVALQRRLRERVPLVVVDDLGRATSCELAVNPSPGGEAMRPDGAEAFLGGAAYALLRAAFCDARQVVLRRGRAPRTALVSSGATNLHDITARTAAELLRRDPDIEVIAVVSERRGGGLPSDPRHRVLVAPASLVDPLASATVYVGAAGTTAVQAACVGVPSVITPAVADQRGQADALVAAGCAVAAEPAHLATECLRLLDDTGLCDAMARRGRDLVDGRGAARVASAVRRLVRARAA